MANFSNDPNRSSGRRYERRVLESIGQSISVQKREGELLVIDREESNLQLLVHFLQTFTLVWRPFLCRIA